VICDIQLRIWAGIKFSSWFLASDFCTSSNEFKLPTSFHIKITGPQPSSHILKMSQPNTQYHFSTGIIDSQPATQPSMTLSNPTDPPLQCYSALVFSSQHRCSPHGANHALPPWHCTNLASFFSITTLIILDYPYSQHHSEHPSLPSTSQ